MQSINKRNLIPLLKESTLADQFEDEDDSINMCIYSQSLMGSNWKNYLDEGKRVFDYHGEMIICESSERYDKIKEYVGELELHVKKDVYDAGKRWFYIHAIKG